MKKSLLASSIMLSLSIPNAQADIAITNMLLDVNFSVSGVLTEAGDGSLIGIDPFFGHTWTATQETLFLDNTDSWVGIGQNGPFDFSDALASMTDSQIAVGFFFNWNLKNPYASILEIFDCAEGVCTGNGVGWQSTAIPGTIAIFSGLDIPATVPIPASALLMGSGLLGLTTLVRRKKHNK